MSGIPEGSRTMNKKQQEIDLFPKVNRTQVFPLQKCRINCMSGMPEGSCTMNKKKQKKKTTGNRPVS